MQAKPNGWAALFAASHRTEYKFVIGDVTYTAADIPSVPVISKAFADKLGIGFCGSGTIQLSVWAKTEIPKAAAVAAYCRLVSPDGATTTAWVDQGHYFVSSRSTADGVTTLTCRDAMQKGRTVYWDKTKITVWPAPMADVVTDIADFMGVPVDSRTVIKSGNAYKVRVPDSDTTILDVLASIAAAHGGNWIITETGKLRLVPVASVVALPDQILGGAYRGFAKLSVSRTISKVLLNCGDGSAYAAGTDSGAEISGDCLYASQELADALGATGGSLAGVVVDAYSISGAYLDPCIEIGDTIHVADRTTTRTLIVASANIKCTSSYTADLAYQVDIGDEDEYPYVGATKRMENRIRDSVKRGEINAMFATYVNSEEGKASMTAALDGSFVTPADLDGYVKESELSTEIGQYIDTASGKAKIISAVSGTYQTKAGMKDYATVDSLGDYAKTTELDAKIEAYIDSAEGKASITSAMSGTFQTKSGMGDYVTKTDLSTSIEQYIDSAEGTSKIISACSGTYLTSADLDGYATIDALTEISQSVSKVESKISLSASYDDNSIGSNVRALLELVANPNSSEIQIKADKINFDGFTTFVRNSDLSESGKTTINGGNITTGTISADRIDVSAIKVNKIYSGSTYSTIAIDCSSNSTLYVGGSPAGATKYTEMRFYANEFIFGSWAWTDWITFSSRDQNITTNDSMGNWEIGSSTHPFGKIYLGNNTTGGNLTIQSGKLYVNGSLYKADSSDTDTLKSGNSYSISLSSSTLTPASNDSYNLGSSDKFWSNAYIKSLKICYSTARSITLACDSSGKLTIGGEAFDLSNISVDTLKSGTGYSITLSTKVLTPAANDTYDLGSSSKFWSNAYIKSLKICYSTSTSVTLACSSGGKLTIGGTAFDPSSSGSVSQLKSGSYDVELSSSSLLPGSSNSYNLGSSSYFWNYLYVKTIRLYYGNYGSYYVDLTCNSSGKLLAGGKVVTTA